MTSQISKVANSKPFFNFNLILLLMSKKVKKQCPIDAEGITQIDYKDIVLLKKYLTKFNRIVPRYYSGVSL